jgi:fructose-1,6-bisphosphatase
VEAAILRGSDIVPTIVPVRTRATPKTIGDSHRGAELRQTIGVLEQLVSAYQANAIPQKTKE